MGFWGSFSSGITDVTSSLGTGLADIIGSANALAGSDLGKIGTELILVNNRDRTDSTTNYITGIPAPITMPLPPEQRYITPAGVSQGGAVDGGQLMPFILGAVVLFGLVKVIK